MLCCYEGAWSRAEAYGANESKVIVGFIDYGNIHLAEHKDVIALPRHLSTVPAIATKIHLEGLTDSADESTKGQAAALLKVHQVFFY